MLLLDRMLELVVSILSSGIEYPGLLLLMDRMLELVVSILSSGIEMYTEKIRHVMY